MVFFPPEHPTYHDQGGSVAFPRLRDGELRDGDMVFKPIEYVSTRRGNRIPVVMLPFQDSRVSIRSEGHPDVNGSPWQRHYTLVFSHGNGEDLGFVLPYAEELGHCLQCNVVCYDYTGYGLSEGRTGYPSERDIYADIEAVYSFLTMEKRLDPAKMILVGRSLGSGPTCELAFKVDIRGVILVSPIASCIRVVLNTKRVTLPIDMFSNVDKVQRIRAPVLVIHGDADDVVPIEHGMALHEKIARCREARAGKRVLVEPLWIIGGDHNSIESDLCPEFKTLVFERYRSFLGELDGIPLASSDPSRKKCSCVS